MNVENICIESWHMLKWRLSVVYKTVFIWLDDVNMIYNTIHC